MTLSPRDEWPLSKEEKKRREYEERKYEPGYCSECGEKRKPPRMDICPICHPDTDYVDECGATKEADFGTATCFKDEGHEGPHVSKTPFVGQSYEWEQ